MPELPEVQTVVSDLQRYVGQKLKKIEINDERVGFESTVPFRRFANTKLISVDRRGKYIVFQFDQLFLVQHLRMTGQVLPLSSKKLAPNTLIDLRKTKKARLFWHLQTETLVFHDTRRFGTVTAIDDLAAYWQRKHIAPDPMNAAETKAAQSLFLTKAAQANRAIKAVLLDQSIIAGVGNIYADEALHRTRIFPETKASSLAPEQLTALYSAIKKVFREAISKRGTTQSDYLDVNGNPGVFKKYLNVYRRTGEICKTCKKTKIEKMKVAGRSTHYCGNCQKPIHP